MSRGAIRPSYANPDVLEFYSALPFNYYPSVEQEVEAIRAHNHIASYPPLVAQLRAGRSVLEAGCGTGWFSNAIAYHYGLSVVGIDFNPVALERAEAVASALALTNRFEVADLFTYQPEHSFELLISVGVLNHTDDCHAALTRLCRDLLAPGGHAFIGLYHRPSRAPFLEYFQALAAQGASEAEQLTHFRALNPQLTDETHARSWFRDQLQHPHETLHTLAEMLPLLEANQMRLVSCSINQFQPIDSIDALLEAEANYELLARQQLAAGRQLSDLFLFLAQRCD